MINVDDEFIAVDPEMEKIWREDDEPSFTEVRASMESEQPEATAETEDSDEEEQEPVSTEEETADDAEESNEDKPETKPEVSEEKAGVRKIKANGMDFEFTIEELEKLAPKALDYTKKMQEIAPWRKTISALKESGLGESDVNMMIDVLKGDKHAIEEVLRRTKVDPLALDSESKNAYVPNDYGKDDSALAIEEVVSRISSDVEYATTVKVVDDVWDSKSRAAMKENPSLIQGLHEEIKMGRYSVVAPIAEKMKLMDDGKLSDLEYYQIAVNDYIEKTQSVPQKEVPYVDPKQAEIKSKAAVRKAASPTKSTSGKRDVIDYLDDNDEDYDEWYKKTVNSR